MFRCLAFVTSSPPRTPQPPVPSEALLKEVLEAMESLVPRISKLQKSSGPLLVVTEVERRWLAFVEKELGGIVSAFRQSSQPWLGHGLDMAQWLENLKDLSQLLGELIGRYEQDDPLLEALRRRAAHCVHRANPRVSYGGILSAAEELYSAAMDPHIHVLKCGAPADGFVADVPEGRLGRPAGAEDGQLSAASGGLHKGLDSVAVSGGLPLVGMDGPAKKLLWCLKDDDDDKRRRVVSILGPAGVGKTTLATQVIQQRLQLQPGGRGFQCCATAHVPWGAGTKEFLYHILRQINGAEALRQGQHAGLTRDDLMYSIRNYLQNKRYIILIDDMRDMSYWEHLQRLFPNNNLGSRIVITTRVRNVALSSFSSYGGRVLKMKPLNPSDSESLLCTKALSSPSDGLPVNLKIFWEDILWRCQGIPLFITGMADWLRQQVMQPDISKSCSMEKDPCWRLKQFEEALYPTYSGLPFKLRFLSMYVSMLPHGYKFKKHHLIMKWLNEQLSNRGSWVQSEHQAEECFSQLVDRYIITPVAEDSGRSVDEDEACYWQVNHFMMQLLAAKSAENGFIYTTTTLIATEDRAPARLALHLPDENLPELLKQKDLSRTRSLALSISVDQIPFDKFINLVILDLEGSEDLKDEDVQKICSSKMFLLAYLSIRNTRVRRLPPEIKELWRLRVLDISHTKMNELPEELFELELLSRLDLRSTQIGHLPEQIGRVQSSLQHLLVGGEEMVNLVETETRIPEDISRVGTLETLATVNLSEYPVSFVKSLGDLARLRVLAVTWSFQQCSDRTYQEALQSSIEKWKQLESLTIHCGLGCSMEFVELISDPPKKLQKFKVTDGIFCSVPQWIKGLEHLAFLEITVCKLAPVDVHILGNLDELRCLVLGLEFIPRHEIMIANIGFRKLLRFSVTCLMPWLIFRIGAMPELQYLQLNLRASSTRTSVPSGINNLRSLSEVDLRYNAWYVNSTGVEVIVKAVKSEVAKHRNPIDLFINGIQDEDVQAVEEMTETATDETQTRVDAEAKGIARAVHEVVIYRF
ncbi:hypothetical protein ACP4OV_008903 [Aristida adscensionis]